MIWHWRLLFADEYLAACSEVLSRLGSALVEARLQADDAVPTSQLSLGELSLTLLGGPRSQPWTRPLRVSVRLHKQQHKTIVKTKNFCDLSKKSINFTTPDKHILPNTNLYYAVLGK